MHLRNRACRYFACRGQSAEDVRLVQEALHSTALHYVLEVAADGDEAVRRLCGPIRLCSCPI